MPLRGRFPGIAAITAIAVIGAYGLMEQVNGDAPAGATTADEVVFEDVGLFVPQAPIDDGYNHLVVEIPYTGTQADKDASESLLDGLNLSRLSSSTGAATLRFDEAGNTWARYADGTEVLVSGDSSPDIDDLFSNLQGDTNIVDVRLIDQDTLAVKTSYTSAELSNQLALDVLTDEPINAFAADRGRGRGPSNGEAERPSDPYLPQQWGLENAGLGSGYLVDADIDAEPTWTASGGGDGVIVAVLDTGVDFGHPDLSASRWTNLAENCSNGVDDDGNGYVDDCRGWDFINNDSGPWDGNNHYHGTHVAGIIAARSDTVGVIGVAPKATIMDVRVLDTRGSGLTSGFAAGIRYAVDNGARIINMSLGSQPGASRLGFGSVEQAIQYARSKGVIVVAAAGNDNVNIDSRPVWPASFAPDYDNVVTVASTDYSDARSSFSNYGAATVTIGAPGSQILSSMPNGQWKYASGTSMATPMTAGALALLMGDLPSAPVSDVIGRLVNTADPLSSLAGQLVYPGRINVGNLYAEPLVPPVHLEASGFDGLVDGQPIAARLHLTVNDTDSFTGQAFRWEGRLLTAMGGQAYGVVGHEVIANGVTTTTDDQALFVMSGDTSVIKEPALVDGGIVIELGMTLPGGSYALMVDAVGSNDPTRLEAPSNVLFFTVGPVAPPATTAPDPTSAPSPTNAPTTTLNYQPVGDSTPTTYPTYPSTTWSYPTYPSTTWSYPTYPSTTWSYPAYPSTTEAYQPVGGGSPTTAPSYPTYPSTTWSYQPVGDSTPTTYPTYPSTTEAYQPVGGGSPSPTSPPASGPTTTWSYQPVGGGTPTSTTAPNAPTTTMAPVQNGGWELRLVSPNRATLPTTGGLVALYGTFPQSPYVWFGSSPATPFYATPDYILVPLPKVNTPGWVDISLRVGGETVLTAPDAFQFVGLPVAEPTPTTTAPVYSPGGSPSPTTAPTTTAGPVYDPGGSPSPTVAPTTTAGPVYDPGGSPTTTTATPVSEPSPTQDPTSTTAAPTTTAASGPVEQFPNPPGQKGSRTTFTFGEAASVGNGLTVAPVGLPSSPTGSVPVAEWATRRCTTAVCQATRL